VRRIVDAVPCRYLGTTLEPLRIQLCGRVVVRDGDRRVEDELPGRQGRLLFVYLVLERRRPVPRHELVAAVWPAGPPAAADAALSALLSKLRRVLGPERIGGGRGSVSLTLPGDAWVDVEAAGDALHRAESAVAREDWKTAWGPARVVQHVTARPFLPEEDAQWIDERRRLLAEWHLRSLELVAEACLGIGGSELATAERAARSLVERAPYRESGHRALMRALVRRGNAAEALRVYDDLRVRLREELGVGPDDATRTLHRELLARA